MWKSQNIRFTFSPEAAAESLPTCSKESRPCAPSKSWSTREPSSACASLACRYGTTCEPSAPTIQSAPKCSQTYANAATRLSLPEAFRVRIFHAREKARAYAEREVDFGRNMRVSFAKFAPVSYLWKIPHFLFQGDLATYLQTWPRWGMMVRGECFQLPPWVQDTVAPAFGEFSGAGIEAAAESAPWPTVTVKGNGNRSEYGGKSGDGLDTAVKRAGAKSATWPTPTAHDRMPGTTKPHGFIIDGKQKQHNLNDEVVRRAMSSHLTGGKDPDTANCRSLNPDWVEWLMHWPIGWTDIAITSGVFYWLDPSDDPADWTPPLMARITTRKKHRVPRINTLGNGQVPLCAAVAFIYGREILRVALRYDYRLTGNRGEQVKQIGNSVPVMTACAMYERS